jgi:hypothetical protein
MSEVRLTTSHIWIADFWVRTPCSPFGGYHSSGRTYCIHPQDKRYFEDGDNSFSEMLVTVYQDYMAS